MDEEFLERIAYEFRDALEAAIAEKSYGRLKIFTDFPNGCCQYTNDLFAEYLIDKGVLNERIYLISGETKEKHSHYWLLVNDKYFVDITVDQFNGKGFFEKYKPIPRCCVIPINRESLYDLFDYEILGHPYNNGLATYSDYILSELRHLYDEIIIKLNYEE